MFAYIKGKLEYKGINYVVIETCGIGYKIFMSSKAIEQLNENDINDTKVYTYYYVREDNISLYGFLSNEELRMFELLLSVSGIGAKSAITMLSEINPSEFAIAIISNDISKLVKIPGIGNKTAARIVLELKDKIKSEQSINIENKTTEVIKNNEKTNEAISAMQVLGYSKKEVEKAIEKIENSDNLEVEDIIRKLLLNLGR